MPAVKYTITHQGQIYRVKDIANMLRISESTVRYYLSIGTPMEAFFNNTYKLFREAFLKSLKELEEQNTKTAEIDISEVERDRIKKIMSVPINPDKCIYLQMHKNYKLKQTHHLYTTQELKKF